jgi:hypothetical protein
MPKSRPEPPKVAKAVQQMLRTAGKPANSTVIIKPPAKK